MLCFSIKNESLLLQPGKILVNKMYTFINFMLHIASIQFLIYSSLLKKKRQTTCCFRMVCVYVWIEYTQYSVQSVWDEAVHSNLCNIQLFGRQQSLCCWFWTVFVHVPLVGCQCKVWFPSSSWCTSPLKVKNSSFLHSDCLLQNFIHYQCLHFYGLRKKMSLCFCISFLQKSASLRLLSSFLSGTKISFMMRSKGYRLFSF